MTRIATATPVSQTLYDVSYSDDRGCDKAVPYSYLRLVAARWYTVHVAGAHGHTPHTISAHERLDDDVAIEDRCSRSWADAACLTLSAHGIPAYVERFLELAEDGTEQYSVFCRRTLAAAAQELKASMTGG